MGKNPLKLSVISLFLAGSAFWLIGNRSILTGQYTFGHDTFYWYAIFHYFTESLWSGFFPLWNPYLHAGELFMDKVSLLQLVDPVILTSVIAGKLFALRDILSLYETTVFLRLIVIAAGVQLLLNRLLPEIKEYAYFTFFVLLLSSFTINGYHQNGAFFAFSYTPFILLFFLRFVEKPGWFNSAMLGYFSGISFQSLQFAYVITFVLLFIAVFLILNREGIAVLLRNKLKLCCALILFLIFSFPAWVLMFYKSSLYPYARTVFNPGKAPYFFIPSLDYFKDTLAGRGEPGDFISLGFLPLAQQLYRDAPALTGKISFHTSEINLYIGLIPFAIGIAGIFLGRHKFKPVFLMMLFLSAALFIGPRKYNIIYMFLFYLIPSLRGLENTHEFANYFLLCYFFFLGLK